MTWMRAGVLVAVVAAVGCEQKTPTAPASVPGKPVNWGQGFGTQQPSMGGAQPAAPAAAPAPTPTEAAAEGDLAIGMQVFANHCVRCHGKDGAGGQMPGIGPVPALGPIAASRSEDEIATTIVKGRGRMPGLGNMLQEGQVRAVVAYVKSLAK